MKLNYSYLFSHFAVLDKISI